MQRRSNRPTNRMHLRAEPDAALKAMEDKANQALNEAEALAELRAGAQEDDLDELIAQLERDMNADAGNNESASPSAEEELAAIQEKLKNK